jgi:hypothetical protein
MEDGTVGRREEFKMFFELSFAILATLNYRTKPCSTLHIGVFASWSQGGNSVRHDYLKFKPGNKYFSFIGKMSP